VISYLEELYFHQEWADAEHWRAFESHLPALQDQAIGNRLLHIHQVQHAFLWIVGSRTSGFDRKQLSDFSSLADLKAYGRQFHRQMRQFLQGLDDSRLAEVVEAPWFSPPLKLSRRHALMQAALHSHYHRGQNATRLRELGSVPPNTDFIVWLRDGQPAASWS
jgi:uncharacterized damage-inducible protein DinB